MTARSGRRHPALAIAAASLIFGTTSVRADDLAGRLTTALAHPGLRGATLAALVVRAQDGRVLFERTPDRLLAPASNLKLLTALAAFAIFGPAHRFSTEVSTPVPLDDDGAATELAVRGGGDPALTSEEWWRLAADLRRAGLRHVRGALLLDDSYFDQQRANPAWEAGGSRAFEGPVGALTANYGAFAVEIRPRRGRPPTIALDPPLALFELRDQLAPGSGALTVTDENAGDRERVVVSGAAPNGGDPVTLYRSVSSPARYAAAVLRMQLAAQGIAVDGVDRFGPVPRDYSVLLAFEGKPLADIARLMMKYSNNNIAEMLVKNCGAVRTGAPGTWSSGLAATRQQLVVLGVPADSFQTVDGSGLSPTNRVSPRALVEALRIARGAFAFGPEFLSALPIAGRDGTLAKRAPAAADAVRAKTGLLAVAAALSGYAHTAGGDDVIFSLLVNDYRHGDADAMAGIDAFATALVQ